MIFKNIFAIIAAKYLRIWHKIIVVDHIILKIRVCNFSGSVRHFSGQKFAGQISGLGSPIQKKNFGRKLFFPESRIVCEP